MSKPERSIDLSKTEEEDEIEEGGESGDEEAFNLLEKKDGNIFARGGHEKDKVINKLIKYFGLLVIRLQTETDFTNADECGQYEGYCYQKAPNAALNVLRTRVLLKDSENYDSKDFTIFISKRNWVKNELRPLLELCSEDRDILGPDRDLAMRCCRLILVLIKDLRDPTKKALTMEIQKQRAQETKEQSEERYQAEMSAKRNAMEQITALLSFKDALCTDKCAKAIALVIADAMEKEAVRSSSDTKSDLATCISYLRRMLSIDAAPQSSPAGEIMAARASHNRFIVSHKALLGIIPSICVEITNRYHDDWLSDIVLIVLFSLRGHEAKDLFAMWKRGALLTMDQMQSLNYSEVAALCSGRGPTELDLENDRKRDQEKLRVQLSKDRMSRAVASNALRGGTAAAGLTMRHSRFGGNYRVTVNLGATGTATATATATGANPVVGGVAPTVAGGQHTQKVHQQRSASGAAGGVGVNSVTGLPARPVASGPISMVVRNPFGQLTAPQAKLRHSKKHITFAQANPYLEKAAATSNAQEGERACAIVATMVTFIIETGGLMQLVRRVNEDLRRSDGRITDGHELGFFQLLSTCLQFNRYKLMEQKKQSEVNSRDATATAAAAGAAGAFSQAAGSTKIASGPAPGRNNKAARGIAYDESEGEDEDGEHEGRSWVPGLQNVINALDRISFNRVTSAMERLHDKEKRYMDVVFPMEVFKEMICYLRLMLESGNADHHDIAAAALYRIFYVNSERQDPLPRLLREWKPGMYAKRHLVVLAELVHETLKTLDAAHACFQQRDVDGSYKKKQKFKKGGEMDIDQYIANCLKFDVNEYFKRLVTHDTVNLFTRILEQHEANTPVTNHHAYCFFQRMWSFRLERSNETSSALHHHSHHNTAGAEGQHGETAAVEPVIIEAPNLGYMLFNIRTFLVLDAFLNDPSVPLQKHLEPMVRLARSVVRRFGQLASRNHMMYVEMLFPHIRPHTFCLELDNVYEAPLFAYPSMTFTDSQAKKSKGAKHSSNHGRVPTGDVRANSSTAREEVEYEDEHEFDDNDDIAMANAQIAKSKTDAVMKKKAGSAGTGARARGGSGRLRRAGAVWTSEEDTILRAEYAKFRGTANVFGHIVHQLSEIGKKVSRDGVERRIRALRLHVSGADSDEEDDEDEDDEEDSASGSDSGGDSGRAEKRSQRKRGEKRSSALDGGDNVDDDKNSSNDSGDDDIDDDAAPARRSSARSAATRHEDRRHLARRASAKITSLKEAELEGSDDDVFDNEIDETMNDDAVGGDDEEGDERDHGKKVKKRDKKDSVREKKKSKGSKIRSRPTHQDKQKESKRQSRNLVDDDDDDDGIGNDGDDDNDEANGSEQDERDDAQPRKASRSHSRARPTQSPAQSIRPQVQTFLSPVGLLRGSADDLANDLLNSPLFSPGDGDELSFLNDSAAGITDQEADLDKTSSSIEHDALGLFDTTEISGGSGSASASGSGSGRAKYNAGLGAGEPSSKKDKQYGRQRPSRAAENAGAVDILSKLDVSPDTSGLADDSFEERLQAAWASDDDDEDVAQPAERVSAAAGVTAATSRTLKKRVAPAAASSNKHHQKRARSLSKGRSRRPAKSSDSDPDPDPELTDDDDLFGAEELDETSRTGTGATSIAAGEKRTSAGVGESLTQSGGSQVPQLLMGERVFQKSRSKIIDSDEDE